MTRDLEEAVAAQRFVVDRVRIARRDHLLRQFGEELSMQLECQDTS